MKAASAAAILLVGVALGVVSMVMVQTPRASDGGERFRRALVARVIDGDTVELASGERVRYLGLDTPEMLPQQECGAVAATELNRVLVEGREVELLPGPEDRDRFGRLLRYVFVESVFVNAELVREGMARPQAFHPDERFHQVLTQIATDSRLASRGLWSVCGWN